MGIAARALHVECFDLDGEVGEEDGAVDFVRHSAFGGFGTVKSLLDGSRGI